MRGKGQNDRRGRNKLTLIERETEKREGEGEKVIIERETV